MSPISDIENTMIRIGGSLKTRGVLSLDLFTDTVIDKVRDKESNV